MIDEILSLTTAKKLAEYDKLKEEYVQKCREVRKLKSDLKEVRANWLHATRMIIEKKRIISELEKEIKKKV